VAALTSWAEGAASVASSWAVGAKPSSWAKWRFGPNGRCPHGYSEAGWTEAEPRWVETLAGTMPKPRPNDAEAKAELKSEPTEAKAVGSRSPAEGGAQAKGSEPKPRKRRSCVRPS